MSGEDIATKSTIFPTDERQVSSFNENGSAIIKVVGVGGGGNNAVNYMYKQNIPGVSFVVTNTDRQALHNSPVPEQVLLGPNTSRGLGAGNSLKKPKRQPRKAQRSSPSSSTRTQKWCLSPPAWAEEPVREHHL